VKLLDVVERAQLRPWAEDEKIPWHEAGFSQRMLREHLTQAHDAASRRLELVDRHVRWLAGLLESVPSRILDLACGPGLYSLRFGRLGHHCVGLDFSPASIQHASGQQEAGAEHCEFQLRDLRKGEYGRDFDLALLIFGELNVFRREEASAILSAAHAALAPAGRLVLEVHTFESIQAIGMQPSTWYASPGALFSDDAHLCLKETAWDPAQRAATERYFVIDAASGAVSRYGATIQAYSEPEYDALLQDAGFTRVQRHASLSGEAEPEAGQEMLFVLTAQRL
jgi:SAM-dependent methyltransferase